jgi:hypothetical protein
MLITFKHNLGLQTQEFKVAVVPAEQKAAVVTAVVLAHNLPEAELAVEATAYHQVAVVLKAMVVVLVRISLTRRSALA